MNKRKDFASRQPGIESFFSKSQRTEGNEGADKAACLRRPANMALVPSAVRVQPVTVTPVDTNVMLKTMERKFPGSIDGSGFHSFYHCREKRCSLKEPAFSSCSKGETVRHFTIELLLNEKRMRKRLSLSFPVLQPEILGTFPFSEQKT